MHTFTIPRQYYEDLHKEYHVNYQLNRFLTYVGEEELDKFRTAAKKVATYEEWKHEFLALAEKALAKGDKIRAGYYFRAAEFFMWREDPDKRPIRSKFLELVREGYNIKPEQRHLIPYTDGDLKGYLPAYDLNCKNPRETIVVMGGGDSYVEEWLPMVVNIFNRQYRVILFEAPGQGGALEEHNLPMTHEYHKAARCVLDYFGLDDVTFWGISGGGMAAIRVAAFEKRVKRVISHDILFDVFDLMLRRLPRRKRFAVKTMMRLKLRRICNLAMKMVFKKDMSVEGLVRQGMMIHGVKTPYDYLQKVRLEKTGDISHLVTQDVLLLAGSEDFAVPVDHFYRQIEALTNVKSLTARLFTRAEQAHNHCQVGNLQLALDTIINWLEFQKTQDYQEAVNL